MKTETPKDPPSQAALAAAELIHTPYTKEWIDGIPADRPPERLAEYREIFNHHEGVRADVARKIDSVFAKELATTAQAHAKDRELLEIARSSIELLRGQLADAKQALAEERVKSEGLNMTCIHHEADIAQAQAREASLVASLKVLAKIPVEDFGWGENHRTRPITALNGHELRVGHVLDAREALARHHAATLEGKL